MAAAAMYETNAKRLEDILQAMPPIIEVDAAGLGLGRTLHVDLPEGESCH